MKRNFDSTHLFLALTKKRQKKSYVTISLAVIILAVAMTNLFACSLSEFTDNDVLDGYSSVIADTSFDDVGDNNVTDGGTTDGNTAGSGTTGGNTTGSGTTDGNITGNGTTDGNTAGSGTTGGNTAGSGTTGGNTTGSGTTGGNTTGSGTTGGNTAGSGTTGGNTAGSGTTGGNTAGGGTTGADQVGAGCAQPIDPATIPTYTDQAFIRINGNIPNFGANELKAVAYESYGALDNLGRVTVAVATLGRETMPKDGESKGDISSIKPTGWVQKEYDNVSGKWLYNRCHLIGWQLSAENANRQNLITGTRYFNTEGMLPFENMVADYIHETGNHVAYRVTPVFENNNLLCMGVQIEAYSIEDRGEGISFNVFCYNVQPQININYATGESTSSDTEENPTPTPNPETPPTSGQVEMVWIPTNGGKKYHNKSTCSGMVDPVQVTKEEAINRGFGACGRCY